MPTFETPPESYIEAEVNALIAEERAQLTNRCNWFEKALEERTDQLNETERAVVRLHHENKTLRDKLEEMWEWTTSNQDKIQAQEELLQSTKTALRRAEERAEARDARPAVEDESPVQRQLHQALEQARKQVRELRVALDEKEDEINYLSKELHNATAATLTPTQSLALRNYKRVQLEDAIEEMLPMLAAENEFLKQVITKAWELGSAVEATYYDYKRLASQPGPGSSESSALAIGYTHDEMTVDVYQNASPELEVYTHEPEMDYSIYDRNARLRYLTRRDPTPTIMTIDTDPEQSYLDEMDVGVDTSPDQEMVNAGSDTAITGPLIRRSPPSKAWTAFRESPTLDIDSENEDKEPLSKRQRDRPLGDKEDKGQATSDECWCSQLSILDETLVRHMASLKIIDNAVAVIDKASSPPAPALSRTSRSIGVQAEVQVPPDVHAEDKNGPADAVTPLPPGTRSSKSFALFSNGPVYLPHLRIPSWHGWTWRSKPDPPPGQEKKRPTILDLPSYPKVDPPLPDKISPIREALSTRVDGQPIPRGQPSGTSVMQPVMGPHMPDNSVSGSFVPPERVPLRRPKIGIDCWIVLVSILVVIYMWLSRGQDPPDAGWMDANEVPHGVLHKLRDDQISDFRFPEIVDYQMIYMSLLDRVAQG
ncbi:hypothetical protein ATEIFO6365_0012035600 [Aspergillus terreus]|uniref:Uncharacterized protein n=1 Tax=Aspergillus terreus TaxID=33178 RepID=A0A5M3ZEP3_ASPTE|nr:hypothetical protein ATETN484_0013036600 [Aspergillus terreus]GFF20600.1 hypothetical protein ATEIFO6365_0012035600 [Aspergillus terreus]